MDVPYQLPEKQIRDLFNMCKLCILRKNRIKLESIDANILQSIFSH